MEYGNNFLMYYISSLFPYFFLKVIKMLSPLPVALDEHNHSTLMLLDEVLSVNIKS